MAMDTSGALDAETLQLFADSVDRYGQERYGFDQYKACLRARPGYSEAAWRDYAQMGWLSVASPVDAGGFGGDPAAVAALARFAGGHLSLEPLIGSAVWCGRLLALCHPDGAAAGHLRTLADGSRIFALAHAETIGDPVPAAALQTRMEADGLHGGKRVVLHGDLADVLLVTGLDGDGVSLWAVDAHQPQVRRTPCRLLDGRGAASIALCGARAEPLGPRAAAAPLLARALEDARLALCAEAHGAMRALNRLTLAYLKERRQFGRPIGANQALQHRMVDLFMLEQETGAVISAALRAMADTPVQRQRALFGAAAHAAHAGRQIAHEAVQMHGGIGTTHELAVSHYFKRIMVVCRLLGDRDAHLDAFAEADRCLGATQGGAS